MAYAAGLLGIYARRPSLPAIDAAIARAPWRGHVCQAVTEKEGVLVALGETRAGRHGHVSVALHGRIDNLDTLASELGTPTDDDTGIVAAAYLRFGEEFAAHLLGNFAVLIIDSARHQMVGARDWLGTVPLFWGRRDDTVVFASEVKQVLALLDIQETHPNKETLAFFEDLREPSRSATFVHGVEAVIPNGQTVVSESGVRSWRRPLRFAPIDVSLEEALPLVREKLETAVTRRTQGARRLGVLLSSGMDSTSVAGVAVTLATRDAGPRLEHAFTYHHPRVPSADETAVARDLCEFWGVAWTPVTIERRDPISCAEELFQRHDGPWFPGGCSWVKLAHAARDAGIDVLLTGDGGDYWLLQTATEIKLAMLRDDWFTALRWIRYYSKKDVRGAAQRTLKALAGVARRERAEAYYEDQADSFWSRLGFETEEREAMRHGIRVEMPYTDFELASLLAGLPPRVRSSTVLSKLVLREAMSGILPDTFRNTPRFVFADAVLARALDDYDGSTPVTIAIAMRYAEVWRRVCADPGQYPQIVPN